MKQEIKKEEIMSAQETVTLQDTDISWNKSSYTVKNYLSLTIIGIRSLITTTYCGLTSLAFRANKLSTTSFPTPEC